MPAWAGVPPDAAGRSGRDPNADGAALCYRAAMAAINFGRLLILTVIGLSGLIGVAVVFGGVLAILAFVGGPDLQATCGDRDVPATPTMAAQFDTRWDAFQDDLDSGLTASVRYTEADATARARAFIAEHNIDEIEEVTICFFADPEGGPGFAEGRGKVSVPVLPDVTARLRGTVELRGDVPRLDLTEIDVGSLPGFVTGAVESAVESAVNDGFVDMPIDHDFTLRFEEGVVIIEGRP